MESVDSFQIFFIPKFFHSFSITDCMFTKLLILKQYKQFSCSGASIIISYLQEEVAADLQMSHDIGIKHWH